MVRDRHVRVHGEALGQPSGRRAPRLCRLRRGRSADRGGPPPALLAWCCSTRSRRPTPDVFNTLLQVMDDGRLTDGQGRTVSFKNTVLIMTSNIPGGRAGVEAELQAGVHQPPRRHRRVRSADPGADRRDRRPPGERVVERVARARIELELTDDARTLLGNLGYDPTYGARPLKRVIQKRLVDPLALAILEGRFVPGDTVEVEARDGELVLERAGAARAPPDPAVLWAGAAPESAQPRPGTPWYKSRPPRQKEPDLPTYIMLTTLTPEGVQTIKNNPAGSARSTARSSSSAPPSRRSGPRSASSTSSTWSRRRTRRRSRGCRSSSDRAGPESTRR